MSITAAKKQEIIGDYRRSDKDSGSPQVQIALLTERINSLTQHMRTHRHDFSSRRGLLKLVAKRNNLQRYLQRKDRDGYRQLIEKLGLRK